MSDREKYFKPVWSEKDDNYLRKFYGDPDHSASKIGRHLKRTRNAVIGRAQRLGLAKPNTAREKVVAGKTYKTPSIRKF